MEDDGIDEGIFSEGWVMTWVGDLEWTVLTAGTEKGAVVKFKGEPGVGELEKLIKGTTSMPLMKVHQYWPW